MNMSLVPGGRPRPIVWFCRRVVGRIRLWKAEPQSKGIAAKERKERKTGTADERRYTQIRMIRRLHSTKFPEAELEIPFYVRLLPTTKKLLYSNIASTDRCYDRGP